MVSHLVRALAAMLLTWAVIVALALATFVVTAWIVDVGVRIATGLSPSADFVALSAAILTFGGLAAPALRMVAPRRHGAGSRYEGHEVA